MEDRQVEKEILIIDDDELLLSILKTHLEGNGFRVQTCPSAAAAVALAKVRCFDVFIIDYRLSEMTEEIVTAAIRRMQPSAIIIGYSMELKEQAFLSAGADAFILKEKTPSGLSGLIRAQQAQPCCN